MEDKTQKRKKRVQRMAQLGRKYKAYRYLLIALLAVVIFCDHLVHNTSRRFKVSVALVVAAALVAGLSSHAIVVTRENRSNTERTLSTADSGMTVSPVQYTLSCSTVDDSQVVTKFQLPVMNTVSEENMDHEVEMTPMVSETVLTLTDSLPEGVITEIYETTPVEEAETAINIEETEEEEVASSYDGEEASLSVSVSMITEQEVSSDSISEDDILRVGYEEAPEILFEITNEGDSELIGLEAEAEYFEMVSEDEIGSLAPDESKQFSVRLKAEQEAGLYTEEMRICAENVSGEAYANVSQEVRREITTLVVSAPNLEIEVGDEIPVIHVEDYLAEGLRDDDTVSMIDGIRETTYDIENSNEPGEAVSEELTELKHLDYNIEFHTGTLSILPRVPDESYYQVIGAKNENQVYVSDITISSNGIDGFDLMSESLDGEYKSELTVSADAVEKGVELYFAKGDALSEKTIFTYTKDTTAPVITAVSEGNLIQDKIHCLTSEADRIQVQIQDWYTDKDGEKQEGTGIRQLTARYQDESHDILTEDNRAFVSVSENFYGQVEIFGQDMGGNASNHLEGLYLSEHMAPTVSFNELDNDRILVTVRETGPIVSGIADCVCMKNREVYTPEQITVKEQTVLLDGVTVMTEYSFEVPVVNKDELAIAVRDYADNTTTESLTYKKKIIDVAYPTDLNLAIDPSGATGMGQVLSDDKEMINYSNVPVEIEIKDLYYTFAENEEGEALEKPVGEPEEEKEKQVYLYWSRATLVSDNSFDDGYRKEYKEYTKETQKLPWGQQILSGNSIAGAEDIVITDQHLQEPITIKLGAAEYTEDGQFVRLSPDSIASFRFFGSISENPDQEWVDKNITVHVVYTMKLSH